MLLFSFFLNAFFFWIFTKTFKKNFSCSLSFAYVKHILEITPPLPSKRLEIYECISSMAITEWLKPVKEQYKIDTRNSFLELGI